MDWDTGRLHTRCNSSGCAAAVQQILIHMNHDDEDLVKMLKHMYTHYDDLIKESLGL